MEKRTCQHPDGCPNPAHKRGWCSMHYQRVLTYGDAGPAARLKNDNRRKSCSVEGCEKPMRANGLCILHHGRVRFRGEVGPVELLRNPLSPEIRAYSLSQRHRFYKYGLTPQAFEAMLTRQKNRCYICGTDAPGGKGWSVDHCHETKAVRFIACNPCNSALGLIREDPRIARRLYEVALECQQLRMPIDLES